MGMSTYIFGKTETSENELEKYKAIYKAYGDADLDIPDDIFDMVHNESPELEVDNERVGDDGRDIWRVDVDKLVEKNIKYVYFVNSY